MNITGLPTDLQTQVFSRLEPKAATSLAITCKHLHSLYVGVQLQTIPKDFFPAYVQHIVNKFDETWKALCTVLQVKTTYPEISLRLASARLPRLETLLRSCLPVTELCVEDALTGSEMEKLSSLFQELEISQNSTLKTVHLLDCSNCSSVLAAATYPPAMQELFLREVVCTQETLKSLEPCQHLRKVYIEPKTGSLLPRKELQQLESSKQLEVAILEDKASDYSLIFDSNTRTFSIKKIKEFLYGSDETKNLSLAEKFLFLIKHLLFYPSLQKPLAYQFCIQDQYKELFKQLKEDLNAFVKGHPQHVPSLLSLSILQLLLDSEKESIAKELSKKACDIEPNSVLAKVVQAYCCRKEKEADERKQVISLIQELSGQLVDDISILMLDFWAHKTQQVAEAVDDYRKLLVTGSQSQLPPGMMPLQFFHTKELVDMHDLSGDFKRFCFLHQARKTTSIPDAPSLFRVNPAKEFQSMMRLQRGKCHTLYPKYIPFFEALGTDDTTWEKSFSPQELVRLKEWKF